MRDTFLKTLKTQGYSLTRQREALYEVLSDGDAFSMNQLVQRLKPVMDRTSVYRGVALFEKIGVINRIQIGWKYKLELSADYAAHHHHAACLQCGKVTVFEENEIFEANITHLADSLGFSLSGHTLELRGTCSECVQTDNRSKAP